MPLRDYKATSPGRRFMTRPTFEEITTREPYKPLLEPQKRGSGRNNAGRMTVRHRGGGLGLPIARRTAELHGGSLTLECPADGGTIVTMTLPIRPTKPLADTATASAPQAQIRPQSART